MSDNKELFCKISSQINPSELVSLEILLPKWVLRDLKAYAAFDDIPLQEFLVEQLSAFADEYKDFLAVEYGL